MKKHISYSELKTWAECSWRHKLEYIDGLRFFKGNEYTSFGKALHTVGEKFVAEELTEKPEEYFELQFLNELRILAKEDKDLVLDTKLVQSMRHQGALLAPQMIPGLKEYFEDYDVFSVEEKLYEPIGEEKSFKGFIDLVLKKDDEYHIIDWKTCSWGWKQEKKQDRLITYQLTLYKHYFAKKHNIDPKQIKTYFALLKRTAKQDQIEIFHVSSGPRKTKNALNLLSTALYNIESKRYVKNKLSCRYCPFDNNPTMCKK